jgi:drug/metabolite transporter (DMT)-like permease
MRWRADAVLVAVTAVWGVDFVVVKNLLGDMPPLTLLFWRFAAATVLLSLLLPWRRHTRGLVSDGLVLGLLLALGMGLQVVGQVETTASKAAFLTGIRHRPAARPKGLGRGTDPSLRCGSRIANLLPHYSRCEL